MKYKAFTLAEVLVTLAVIGVVAALTIPAIVSSSQESGTVSQVLKYQSLLNQAFDQYAVDKNCVGNLACTGTFEGDSSHEQIGNEIKQYLNVVKDCGIAPNQGCFASGVTYKYLNGNEWAFVHDSLTSAYKFILADGSSLLIGDVAGNCSGDNSKNDSGPLYNVCAWVHVDVNGHKGPNQFGKDLFAWRVTKSGVYPNGALDDNEHTDASGNIECEPTAGVDDGGNGTGCTAKVIKERAIDY